MKAIEGHAFSICTSLSNVKFMGTQEPSKCDKTAFEYCPLLKEIIVPFQYENETFCGLNIKREHLIKRNIIKEEQEMCKCEIVDGEKQCFCSN